MRMSRVRLLLVALFSLERFPSGQREQTVNLPAQPSEVRILPSPLYRSLLFAISHQLRNAFSIVENETENASLPAGVTQLVESQPSKLLVAGSNPVSRSFFYFVAHVAQSVEHILGKDEVTGSIPVVSSKYS